MYVIARYNEDVTWANSLELKFIVQKDIHLPNKGREASSYLWYIINFYDELNGTYRFRQGHEGHTVHQFNLKGCLDPEVPGFNYGLNILKGAKDLNLKIPEDEIIFSEGAQFDVPHNKILQRSLSWYENAYDFAIRDHDKEPYNPNNNMGPWVLERLWKYIFDL